MEDKKMYKPTNDYVFSRIFGYKKNWELLKDLLEAILPDIQIKKIELVKQYSLDKATIKSRGSVLDVLAILNDNTYVNVEMQVDNHHNTIERSIFYDSGIYHESLQKNEKFKKAKRTIGIWFLCYNIFEEGSFHEVARLKRDYENILLTDKMEFHYIQLPKFKEKCKRISNKLEEWLTFIVNDNTEAIKMIDNEYVQKAEDELEYINADEEERMRAKFRERSEWNYNFDMESMYEQGIEHGIEQGKTQGAKEQSIKIAKKMLEKNEEIEYIMEITGLTKEEIQELQD
jgi:predicted transposase/invertase (TIGR01784 family)